MKSGLHNNPIVFKIFPLLTCIYFNFIKQHKYNTNSNSIDLYACSLLCLNNFNLIENFLAIINNKHYLITCAKYYSSNMNDVCTVYLADIVSLTAKVVWLTAFFLKKKTISYGFCVGHWPANLGVSS